MTELVDVLVSGTSFRKGVGVRVSPTAPDLLTEGSFHPFPPVNTHHPLFSKFSPKFKNVTKKYVNGELQE